MFWVNYPFKIESGNSIYDLNEQIIDFIVNYEW